LQNKSILFLGKRDDDHSLRAIDFIKSNFSDVTIFLGEWNDPVPNEMISWRGDYIISYLSRWVLSSEILSNASISAINFHPASPEYPGIGCNNFALYNEERKYGVTCHHMHKHVDTGPIISTKSFPIFESDSVASLLTRTYDFQLTLFYEIMNKILNDEKLQISTKKWTRKPFTRKQFNDLVKIEPDMSEEEIKKRVRATSFTGWQKNKKIILIGAGGHAKSCIEIIENLNEYSIYGLLDNSTQNNKLLDYSILGTDVELNKIKNELGDVSALITVGQIKTSNARQELFEEVKKHGFETPIIISRSAYVSKHSKVNSGTIVMNGVIVNASAVIGENCILNNNSLVEHDTKIGGHCHISTGTIINGGAEIGSNTFIGSGSIIKQGIKVGNNCLISAGLFIEDDVPDGKIIR
tara:strand:- start:5270 stop:6499 length:1230 start_codon:yes stop_codon:yes gene_type:complete